PGRGRLAWILTFRFGIVPVVRFRDVDLYYEVRGDGPPLLLIPGLGSDVRVFRAVIDRLARRCRVVAFDPRGAGPSGKPDIPYSIEMMADDAASLLQAVELPSTLVLSFIRVEELVTIGGGLFRLFVRNRTRRM